MTPFCGSSLLGVIPFCWHRLQPVAVVVFKQAPRPTQPGHPSVVAAGGDDECGYELQRVFRELDANNDGYFNSYELRNALNSVGMLQLLLL